MSQAEAEATLLETFKAEFAALAQRHDHLVLSLEPMQAWVLFSQIQLALRHPRNVGPSAKIAREIAQGLQGLVATTPAMIVVAERGWREEYDVRADGG